MQDLLTHIGPLLFPLAALSVLGVVFIVERLIFFVRLPALEQSRDFQNLTAELTANAHLDKAVRDELISHRLIGVKEKLEFGVRFLRIIAVLSPMLGLLGTVLGMIQAFKTISVQTGPVAPAMIADGLWSAMLTTAYGLSIALPCLMAAFIYARMAEKRLLGFQAVLNARSLEMEGATLFKEAA